jgi:soluble lytic murein transglycosylase-like protein
MIKRLFFVIFILITVCIYLQIKCNNLVKSNSELVFKINKIKTEQQEQDKIKAQIKQALPKNLSITDRIVFTKAIYDASVKYKIKPRLITTIIEIESNFDKDALGRAGDIGLMQVMPVTMNFIVKKDKSLQGKDIRNPYWNIMFGTSYLSYLMHKFDGDVLRVIVAYNKGHNSKILKNKQKMMSCNYFLKFKQHYL